MEHEIEYRGLRLTKQFCTELFTPTLVQFFEVHQERMLNWIVYLDEDESFLFYLNLFHVLGYLHYISKNPQKARRIANEFGDLLRLHLPFEFAFCTSPAGECQICFSSIDEGQVAWKLKDGGGMYHLDCFDCFFEVSRILGNLARPEHCIKLNLE